jgi:branched-chain amino acid transport system permease protein
VVFKQFAGIQIEERNMNMLVLSTILIDGLILSGVYALAALGFVIIYRATGVFNFAQGELMMAGAYLFYVFTVDHELSPPVAVMLTLAGLAIIGAGLYMLVIRPMTAQPLFATIIITMGVAICMRSAIGMVWGPTSYYPKKLWADQFIDLGGVYNLPVFDLVCILTVGITYAAVIGFMRFSPLGLEMRASAENPTLASQRGVNLNTVFTLSWAIAAVSAATAGAVFASRTTVSLDLAHLGISALPAALVGGLDSVEGALVGALIVGFVQTFVAWQWGSEAQDVVAAAILLLVLMVRPYGLFGTRHINRL